MRVDLSGMRFGRLTVLSKYDVFGNGETRWLCRCDCGKETIVMRGNLKRGITRSCGCYKVQRISETQKKYNKYDLSGEYGIGYTTNTTSEFFFDLDDFEKIKPYTWVENDQGYIATTASLSVRQHRLIFGCEDDEMIDHINRNKKDNRKSNLRLCNKQTNGINRGCNRCSSTGVKGVKIYGSRYIASITKNSVTHHIGIFDSIEEARKSRVAKEIELFGEFAYTEGGANNA